MSTPRKPRIATRKEPKQTRSRQLVSDILTAAGRVLAREGAHRFTAARVAEETGISVGSLYQYFPNKEAILFRLQSNEWEETSALLTGILSDKSVAPLARLRSVVREFVRSECEEVKMRNALDDAAPLYRNAPEAVQLHQAGAKLVKAFIDEVIPHVAESERILVGDITLMSLKVVGKQLSEAGLTADEVDSRSRALGDMFCAYLESFSLR